MNIFKKSFILLFVLVGFLVSPFGIILFGFPVVFMALLPVMMIAARLLGRRFKNG